MKRLALAGPRAPLSPRGLVTLAAPVLLVVACRSGADVVPEPSAPASVAPASTTAALRAARPRFVAAPVQGSVEEAVRDAWAEAVADRRNLIVYVGAVWCEPCQRFHRAADQGELDAAFPNLTLLEFDLDRDRERLASAGYVSKYIPLFAVPTQTGAASGRQVEGGIKGEGAVGFIVPRLKGLLSE
jgi:hypothetical protein